MRELASEFFRKVEPPPEPPPAKPPRLGWITVLLCAVLALAAVVNWSGRNSSRELDPMLARKILVDSDSFGEREMSALLVLESQCRQNLEALLSLKSKVVQDPNAKAALETTIEQVRAALMALRSKLDDRPESEHQPSDNGK